MRLFSSMLRLLTGLVIMAMSWKVIANHSDQIKRNGEVIMDLYGMRFPLTGYWLMVILMLMMAIGLGLVLYGAVGIRHRSRRHSAPPRS